MSKHTNTVEDAILDNYIKYRNNAAAWYALETARHYRSMLNLLNRCDDMDEAKKICRLLMRVRAQEAVAAVKGGRK